MPPASREDYQWLHEYQLNKGTKFGRLSALDASQRRRIAERYAGGETMAELAREYECGEATIWRALQP